MINHRMNILNYFTNGAPYASHVDTTFFQPGLGCTTLSFPDRPSPPRLHLLLHDTIPRPTLPHQGCTFCWVPTGDRGTSNKKCHCPKKVGCTAEVVTQSGRSVHLIWAELYETGRLSATLAVNQLGRCRTTLGWPTRKVGQAGPRSL